MINWIDVRVFKHRWTWLCNLAWDRQLARDADSGKLERMVAWGEQVSNEDTMPFGGVWEAAFAALEAARALPHAQLGAIVATCRDNGAGALADVLVGALPFDGDEG